MYRGRMEVSLRGAAALHTQAFNLYQARQFAEAKAMFVEVRAMFHTIGRNDEPSRHMMLDPQRSTVLHSMYIVSCSCLHRLPH